MMIFENGHGTKGELPRKQFFDREGSLEKGNNRLKRQPCQRGRNGRLKLDTMPIISLKLPKNLLSSFYSMLDIYRGMS